MSGLESSLKDRLLDNTAKSIKRVQEHVFAQNVVKGSSSPTQHILTNDDVVIQPLFKHLDRLFMFGLKKINVGYWPFAVELTHKEVIKELKRLTNVTTNLGKGRAWLYHALNENLLECYLRTIETNVKLVKQFYEKEALFFDQQRMQILITLCSGLECVGFHLDYDVPYLDVDSYLHLEDPDKLSACSTTSVTSATSDLATSDVSPASVPPTTTNLASHNHSKPSSFKADEIVIPNFDESIEVVRVKTKHKKKKRKKPRAVSLDSDHSSISTGTERSTNERLQREAPSPIGNIDEACKHIDNVTLQEHNTESTSPREYSSLIQGYMYEDTQCHTKQSSNIQNNGQYHSGAILPTDSMLSKDSHIVNEPPKSQAHSNHHLAITNAVEEPCSVLDDSQEILVYRNANMSADSFDLLRTGSDLNNTLTVEDPVLQENSVKDLQTQEPATTDTEESSVVSDGAFNENSASQDSEEVTELEESLSQQLLKPVNEFHEKETLVDNNSLLTLMLDVFDSDEEQFHKMYVMCLGHPEGNVMTVHTLMTNCKLYLLKLTPSHKYSKHAVISHTEIDYISLSIGYQMVQIVCTNRRKQFWLATGSETLTKLFVDDLKTAMRLSGCHLPETNILTDATTQRISITKWASQQCRTEISSQDILCLLLGYWEDRSPGANMFKIQSHKEGVLLYKLHTGYMGYGAWKPGYFALSNGVLYQYEDKDDRHTPLKSIQVGSDECGGCRRSKDSDREHSFEIILSNGSVLHLSAATNEESNEWLQCLCQAVSEGQMGSMHHAVACCVVVTPYKILLCHEDVQTAFFRTLASASIEDVTSLGVDPATNQYLVINFESQESNVESEQWVIYPCGSTEWSNLVQSLDTAWSQQFQVSLPLNEIDDVVIRQQCRDTIRSIKGNL